MICTAINQFKKTEDFTSVGRAAKCDLFAEIEAVTKNVTNSLINDLYCD